jgi:hypothetical protein
MMSRIMNDVERVASYDTVRNKYNNYYYPAAASL